MSCKTSPVNIVKTKQLCKEECSYQFDYNPNSSAIVNITDNYLDIQVDGTNTVKLALSAKFNGLRVSVSDVRIYQKSFHLFNGKQADAELVVQHKNPVGDTLLVCIFFPGKSSLQT